MRGASSREVRQLRRLDGEIDDEGCSLYFRCLLPGELTFRSKRHRAAAIDIPSGTDDVTRSLRGHKGDDRGDLVRAAHSANWNPGNTLLANLLFGLAGHLRPFPHCLILPLGVDDIRHDSIDQDIVLGEFGSK